MRPTFAARVEEIGARLCNHCYTSPLTVAASLHWLSTCRDAFLFEDCVEDSPLRHELTHEKVQAVDGWIDVPDRPGLGVTLNEDFVKHHLVAESGRPGRKLARISRAVHLASPAYRIELGQSDHEPTTPQVTARVHFPQSFCRAGVARRDITPPVGIYHRMWGAATHERSTGVHRPLKATALAWSGPMRELPTGRRAARAARCWSRSIIACCGTRTWSVLQAAVSACRRPAARRNCTSPFRTRTPRADGPRPCRTRRAAN